MTITVTLNRLDLDAEERRSRVLRAKEVLSGAGWLFDELISELTRELLDTTPDQQAKRETLYRQIDGTAQAKGRLTQIIEQQAFEDEKNERRSRRDGPADHE